MENAPARHVKGIRIRSLNIVMFVLSLILFVAVFWTTFRVAQDYRATVLATENYIAWEKSAHQIHVASEYLTEQVRLYAQTLQTRHALNYLEELNSTKSREKALELISSQNRSEFKATIARALEYSNELARTELYAIRLVAEGLGHDIASLPESVRNVALAKEHQNLTAEKKFDLARDMLYSQNYRQARKKIMDTLTQFLTQSLAETRHEQLLQTKKLGAVINQQRFALIALCILNGLTFLMIIILIVRPLKMYAKCIREDKMFELVEAYEFNNLALTYNDIFAVKEHHDRMLRHKAEHDPLTGLLNRAAFDSLRDILEHEVTPIALVLIDVDKFKNINDTYGHLAGDKTLQRVAGLIQRSFRADDFCIRPGGDEFAVIVKGSPEAMREIILEKITAINILLAQPEEGVPATSLSVGVAFSSAGFTEALYAHADLALYRVKKAGRKGCAFYDPDLDGPPQNVQPHGGGGNEPA